MILYLQLMRLDRPNGYWYFWCPHAFGTLWATIQQRSPVADLLCVNLALLWGNLWMRGGHVYLAPLLDALATISSPKGGPRLLEALWGFRVDDWPIAAFYAANVIWSLLYEFVYSHQDATEDMAAGVKSLAMEYVGRALL